MKKEDKILLFIRNLINDKLDTSYINIFRIKEVKKVTILFKLLNIKIYLYFYISLLKKISLETL